MRFVGNPEATRRKGLGPFAGLVIALLLLSSPSPLFAEKASRIKLLYFFSSTCRHCVDARESVVALSRSFDTEGLQFGDKRAHTLPFPVASGDKETAKKRYGVTGVPDIAVLVDGVFKQKISGASDIKSAAGIISALEAGAVTVTDAALMAPGPKIAVTGWIAAAGEYFKGARFFITDRKTSIPVKPWLPLEAVKSPFQKSARPRVMSDVVKKPVVLKGRLEKSGPDLLFVVEEEVTARSR